MTDPIQRPDPWAPTFLPPPGYAPPQGAPHFAPPRPGPFSPLVGRPLVPNETTWGTLVHLSIFAFGILGPIIVMLTEGKKSAYTRYHAVEALNMQLTLLIAQVVCIALFWLIVPLLVLFGLAITAYVYAVLAGMAANRGEIYHYPMIMRMVK